MKLNEFPFDNGARYFGLSILELQDASNECPHGRLPFDPSPACGCFKGWEAVVTELRGEDERRAA